VIYRSARVLIVVPEAERGVVEQVALKKIAGGTISKEQVAAVVDGQASFDSLSAGAYEVTYLARTGRPTPSTRRVLIELEPPPEPLSIRLDEPAVGPSVEPVPVDESLQAEVDATWDRLERGASYSSLHRFQQLVTGQSREASAEDATTDLVRVLSGQISLEAVEKSGRMTRRQVAEAWARQLGNRAELANAVYGMGRAYEMIEAEPRPLLAETGRLAEVCYQTAERLDPTLPGPLRDLGLRLLDRGLEEEGGLCLRQASQSAPDAETLMAMGQWHLRRNEVREATAAFEEAHRLDPTFVPALLERTKWSIVPSTGAVYPSELREVTHGLKQLATCPEVSPAERQWAAMQAARLRWMEQEMDANLASFSVRAGSRRTALSAENRTATAKITGAGEPARSIPIAVRATRTVSPAVADAISTQPRADIASVRPVVSNAGEGGRSTVVSSLSLEQPSTLGPAASASSMVSIPRAQPTGRTAAGANSQTPIRIPEAVPKSESSSRMGANR
jgi:tetratricopeptide (TPR) repeat protein